MLHPCDAILIVDHGSRDGTVQVAREYGARVIASQENIPVQSYFAAESEQAWVLCLDPRESLTEGLVASLFEWKAGAASGLGGESGFAFLLREETAAGWVEACGPFTRLVRADWRTWEGNLPANQFPAPTLDGELLRFAFP